ncbi:hypothetical protein [Sphingomonas bacterium]|uniref:DUF6931 family protein n=1 Tax=Sphingomonas bacterium TaxID=1895847 RepID=UPI0026392B55|nr:hypothetical protein [Sphingomonas bacterium]
MGWNQVRWTEAHQIASLMGTPADALPEAGVTPDQHYAALREAGDRPGAVNFLGHALQRLEALAWAARVLEMEGATRELRRPDRQALDHALRWLGDPNDVTRRAAMDAAEAAGEASPERMLGTGVFFSGGSISDPDLPAVLPAPELAGRFAAIAVTLAAARAEDRDAVLDRAMALGERVASEGTGALR